jgi:mRNA-degrading endonuclease toxin of MazEF toxin-antitoxin module
MGYRNRIFRQMGTYRRGDVVLATVPFNGYDGAKTRPAIVLAVREDAGIVVCPVSSRPATDAPCVPIGLDDFSEGGLDLFSESFALATRITVIPAGAVIAKKGRLTADAIDAVAAEAPRDPAPGKNRKGGRRK